MLPKNLFYVLLLIAYAYEQKSKIMRYDIKYRDSICVLAFGIIDLRESQHINTPHHITTRRYHMARKYHRIISTLAVGGLLAAFAPGAYAASATELGTKYETLDESLWSCVWND